MDELMKTVYLALGIRHESERERAIRLDQLAQENCAEGKHSMFEARGGMVCRYCGTVGG